MTWVQNYDPIQSQLISPLVAALPIVILLGLLVVGWSAPRSAMAGLATALGVAVFFFKMPVSAASAAAAYGACFGLMPIGWIVLNAVFLYQLTVRSGQFEIVKRSVTAISPDRRMQTLLIAFSLGTFLEGAAGFGTPVAICAALLIGIGFSPLYAAGLSLIANTSPVAFGGLGTPIITLAKVSGLSELALSQMAGRQLPLFSLIIPAWLIAILSGWKGVKGCWPAILVCGGSFAVIQFVIANFLGPSLVGVLGGIGSLIALSVFLCFWQPREVWRFPNETEHPSQESDSDSRANPQSGTMRSMVIQNPRLPSPHPNPLPTDLRSVPGEGTEDRLRAWQVAYAWMPWVILSVTIFLWGWPSFKQALNGGTENQPNLLAGISKLAWEVPGLDRLVYRAAPVVPVPEGSDRAAEAESAVYEFTWLSATGTGIFVAAILSAAWLQIPPHLFFFEFGHTLWRVRWALLTIACMLALAYTTRYSGADATLGLAFTHTGWLYPFFAPLLGWLGVALTGSDTSANALFGNLQRITAEQLKLNSLLIVTSNSTGGVMGKMIDAQSIVVAAAATQQDGQEGQILRFVFWHSVVLAAMMGLLTLAQAYLMPWMIPGP